MSEQVTTFLKQHRPEFVADKDAFLKQNIEQILVLVAGGLSIGEAVDQLDEKKKLVLADEYESAWGQFVYLNPEKGGFAFRRAFLEAMRKKEIQAKYVKEYNDLCKELGEANRGLPISDLREIAAIRRENERRKNLSADELRALARQERPVPKADELPQLYTPFGKSQEIVLTAETLRAAGTRNAALSLRDFRFLCERWGSDKVNQRMGVLSAQKKQYKTLPPEITREQIIAALKSERARIWVRDYGHDALNKKIFEG